MATYYPIELNLTGRLVVVIGGGPVAARKVAGLIDAGARVRVVSPAFADELARRDDVTREERPYAPDALDGADLVFACTDDRELNRRIAADARSAGRWCNVADDPTAGNVLVPATLRQGQLTIAVGTGGAGPALAACLRDEIESNFRPEFAILTDELARARPIVQQRVANPDVRRRIFATLCTDCSLRLLARHDRSAWRLWFERVVAHHLAGTPGEPAPE